MSGAGGFRFWNRERTNAVRRRHLVVGRGRNAIPEVHRYRLQCQTIDWLEAEILGSIASLYRSLARADEDPRVADLANAIIGCYLLAKRLGISYAELDEQINGNIRENIESGHEIERWYGDFSALANHRKGRSI